MCNYTLVEVLGYLYVSIYYFSWNKGLIRVYTIRDIKQNSDKPHGIIVNRGNIISILLSLLSLFVQIHIVKLS